ncbi:MAG: DUF86 domain-containing protein [Thermoanaerobaculia bacterium]
MLPESRSALERVLEMSRLLVARTVGRSAAIYAADPDLQAIVERHFITIGEALARVARKEPELFARIPEAPEVVGFRNVLVHGYDAIDPALVWDALTEDLHVLARGIEEILRAEDAEGEE